MYKIIILSRADLEVDEIIEYYESVSNGLGTRFNPLYYSIYS